VDPAYWLVAFLAAEFLVRPFALLLHELGHASTALRAGEGPVLVSVGRPSSAVEIHFDRLKICFSPMPLGRRLLRPGIGGYCKWDPVGVSPRNRLLVYLAGPLVTALLVLAFVGATIATRDMPGWIPAPFGIGAFTTLLRMILGLDPRPRGADGQLRDGGLAAASYRDWREGRAAASNVLD
jgi:hypothetical protein